MKIWGTKQSARQATSRLWSKRFYVWLITLSISAAKVRSAAARPQELRAIGAEARATYEARYTPEANLRSLMAIYHGALRERHGHAPAQDAVTQAEAPVTAA